MNNYLYAHLLPDEVYNQNNHQDGPHAYSENTHCSVLPSPYLLWAGINLVPVTHRDTTGDGCGCYAWSTDPRSGSDYRVVMLLTLADYLSILRARYGQWIIFYIKAVLLVS